jgi:hypothetical protein
LELYGRNRETNYIRKLNEDIKNNTKYGKLTILSYSHTIKNINKKGEVWYRDFVVCDCECGTKNVIKQYQSLINHNTCSCGCLDKEAIRNTGYNNKKYNEYDLSGEYGIGWTSNTKEEFCFDKEDYDLIKDYCWFNHGSGKENKSNHLATREPKTNKKFYIHNLIMGDVFIDHINNNPLDNRKKNLRKCTPYENSKNTSKPKNSTCEFMGVSIEHGSYVARIGHNRKKLNLGSYSTLEEAIVARLKAEKLYCGEFAPQKDLFEKYGV